MSKFVLIDHSIIDSGGHHFEYAIRILNAAQELGYQTELWINKAAKKNQATGIKRVATVFTKSCWQMQKSGGKFNLLFNFSRRADQ